MLARLCAVGFLAALLGGCGVPSINPLFTADQVVFEPKLVGHWTRAAGGDDEKVHILTAGEDKTYRLTMGDDTDKLDLVIHLVKLGDHYFADTALAPDESNKLSARYAMLAAPTHLVSIIDFSTPDTIQYREFDRDWLFAAVHKDPSPLAHTGTDAKSLILTASTQDLQKFLVGAAANTKAWTEPATFKRVKPPEAAPPAVEPKK